MSPFGPITFIVAKTAGCPVAKFFRGVRPQVVAHHQAIVLMCIFSQLTMWLLSRM